MTLTIGSLCSGYGGLDLAVEEFFGGRTVWVSDIDKNANKILAQRFPDAPNLGDLKVIDWSGVERVDILTAGYPCQPFSQAGKRRGTDDPRHIWPWIAEGVSVLRPRILVFENVRNHLRLGFDVVLGALAELGYDARWGVVRASDAGAPHQRARVFIVATDTSGGQREQLGGPDQRADAVLGNDSGVRSEVSLATADADSARRCQCWGGGAVSTQQPAAKRCCHPAAYASGQRHGSRQDSARLGRLDSPDEGQARQRQRARQEPGHRSAAAPTHADSIGQSGRTARPTDDTRRHETGSVEGREPEPHLRERGSRSVSYGPYEAAIQRWEHALGRTAPAPTEPTGRDGRPRLSPRFVEWMMGLPEGWVTDTGISHVAQLKALGNGVVPQQAHLALQHLTNPVVASVRA